MTHAGYSFSAPQLITPAGWQVKDDGTGKLGVYNPSGTLVFYIGPGGAVNITGQMVGIDGFTAVGTIGVPAMRAWAHGTGATTAKSATHIPTANVGSHGYYAYVNVTAITGSIAGAFTWTDETGTGATEVIGWRHLETGLVVTSIVATGHYVAINGGVTNDNSQSVITVTITPTNATFNYELFLTVNV